MGRLSEFFDSIAYGKAQTTAENAQRDLENMDRLLSTRSITEQTYEEEAAKARAILDAASADAFKYAQSQNTSRLQRAGFPEETIANLSPAEKTQFSYGYQPPKAEATGRHWDMSGPTPTLIEPPAATPAPTAQAAPSKPAMQESGPMTHLDVMKLLPTEGDRLEYKRTLIEKDKAAKLNHAIQYVMQAYPPEEQKHALEMYKEQINSAYAGEDLRRMDEKPIFKQATEVFGQKYRDRVEVLSNFRKQIEKAKSIKDEGEKVLFLQTAIPKMINTIAVAAPDAVGVEEGKRIMGELQSIFNTPITQWGDLFQNKGLIDAALKKPDAFIEKSQNIYNIAAEVNNDKTKHYYNKLGQDALTAAGGVMLNLLKEGDSLASMQAIRTGESRTTPATSYPGEMPAVSNQNMSRPLKRGTVSQSGVRLFGPTPNPFLLQGGD